MKEQECELCCSVCGRRTRQWTRLLELVSRNMLTGKGDYRVVTFCETCNEKYHPKGKPVKEDPKEGAEDKTCG